MPDFIFVKDTESRFLVVNESLAKSYGHSPADMLHRTDAEHARTTRAHSRKGDARRSRNQSHVAPLLAGTCWVMQCGPPPP